MRVARTCNALHYTFYTSQICISYQAFGVPYFRFQHVYFLFATPVCISIERLTIEFLKCVLRIEVNAITAELFKGRPYSLGITVMKGTQVT